MKGSIIMSLFNYINKAKNYIKTYGLIKGIKEIINRKNNKDKALKELNEFLPKVEETVKPVLSNYKDQSIKNFTDDQKNIFVFWWDGFDSAPQLVKDCYNSVEKNYGKDFKIYKVDKTNYKELSDLDEFFINKFNNKKITIQTFSDILRFKLINKLGGVWIDSTVLINKPLNLLSDLKDYGFITAITNNTSAFINYDGVTCSWSSFFIGGSKDNPLFSCLLDCYKYYLSNTKEIPTYFLTDILLTLCKKYKIGDNILNKYTKTNVKFDIFYLSEHLSNKVTSKEKENMNKMTIQKLNWRIDINKIKKDRLYFKCLK